MGSLQDEMDKKSLGLGEIAIVTQSDLAKCMLFRFSCWELGYITFIT